VRAAASTCSNSSCACWGCLDMAGNVRGWTASLDASYPYRFDSGLFAILLLAAMRPSEPPLKRRFLERDKRLSAFGALSPLITRTPFSHTDKRGTPARLPGTACCDTQIVPVPGGALTSLSTHACTLIVPHLTGGSLYNSVERGESTVNGGCSMA
jgi:hypothetical protein